MPFSRALAAVALSAALLGCPAAPRTVVYDLARRVAVADRWSGREVILFGTPAADPHQAEGFYREAAAPDGAQARPATEGMQRIDVG